MSAVSSDKQVIKVWKNIIFNINFKNLIYQYMPMTLDIVHLQSQIWSERISQVCFAFAKYTVDSQVCEIVNGNHDRSGLIK